MEELKLKKTGGIQGKFNEIEDCVAGDETSEFSNFMDICHAFLAAMNPGVDCC